MSNVLNGFKGSLEWVHKQEDRQWAPSKPYWPGGESGVTLRPGIDLGYCSKQVVRDAYLSGSGASILSQSDWNVLSPHIGKRGEEARRVVSQGGEIDQVQISYQQGKKAFPHVAKKYWEGITSRFPSLLGSSVPGAVHTALLSLAFNRGIWNADLASIKQEIKNRNWIQLGQEISEMQQKHELKGIRVRRRREGKKVTRAAALIQFANRQGKIKAADVVPINT